MSGGAALRRSGKRSAGRGRRYCGAIAAVAVALLGFPAGAAQMLVPRIDSFGPYKLGMTLEQAKAAHKGGRLGACGDIAADRQCLVLDAAVFDEPGVIYAVLDPAGAKVERIVAQLDPQRTQRRAYRCVRLSEKVFALLAVVYGSKFKQSYDENRRPLPAVAWDGEISGRLIFETKCRTADEGKPRISIVAHQPEGVEPPKVAERAEPKSAAPMLAAPTPGALPPGNALPPALSPALSTAPSTALPTAPPTAQASAPASAPVAAAPTAPREDGPLSIDAPAINPQSVAELPASISLAEPEGAGRSTLGPEAPAPARAPISVVEEIRPDTSGAVAADADMARLARELAQAKGKAPAASIPTQAEAAAVAAPAPTPAPTQAPTLAPTLAQDAPKVAPPLVAPQQAAPALPVATSKPVQSVDSAVAARLAPPPAAPPPAATLPQTMQTAALPPARPVRPHYADELPEPPDMVAPEPFMVPEEEELFRQRRDAAAPPNGAASAPFALLSVSPPAPRSEPQAQPQNQPQQAVPKPVEPAQPLPTPVVAPARAVASTPPGDPKPEAKSAGRGPVPVLTGGWRHRAPVPPARPWRDRTDTAG
ncbi:MAG: hypothetical protein GEU87_14855 [Alphaproteobacteria bacterium]|nr:hypothetical protein [Alphaproteobacteria bacterium]